MSKKIILFIACLIILVAILGSLFWATSFYNKQYSYSQPSVAEVMEMIKTDKDYNDLTTFIKNFEPQIAIFTKFSPTDYKRIKPGWQKQGRESIIKIVDEVSLNKSTYWIEIKDTKDKTKGLMTILDLKNKKSVLLMASLSIEASLGL